MISLTVDKLITMKKIKKLSAGWWVMILFCVAMEVLGVCYIDYKFDPRGAIAFIHGVPVILILAAIIYGPSKE